LAQGQKQTPGSSSTQIFTCELRRRMHDSSVRCPVRRIFVQMMTVCPVAVPLRHTARVHMTGYIAMYVILYAQWLQQTQAVVFHRGPCGLSSVAACVCNCVCGVCGYYPRQSKMRPYENQQHRVKVYMPTDEYRGRRSKRLPAFPSSIISTCSFTIPTAGRQIVHKFSA
jgi:hypothetical protein